MYHVYQIVEKVSGKLVYIGCSCKMYKRAINHKVVGNLTESREIVVIYSTEDKALALAVEKRLIHSNKLRGQLTNKYPQVAFRIGDQLFSRKQLASYLGCTPGTISNHLREGWKPKAWMFCAQRKRNILVERVVFNEQLKLAT